MLPLTTMQKLKLAITVGKKILAAKDAHDTKKAMETHSYLSAVEKQIAAEEAKPSHVIALTHLAKAEMHGLIVNELKTHTVRLKMCKPGTEKVRAFLEVIVYGPTPTDSSAIRTRICVIPLALADLELLQYEIVQLHRDIADAVGEMHR